MLHLLALFTNAILIAYINIFFLLLFGGFAQLSVFASISGDFQDHKTSRLLLYILQQVLKKEQ